MDNLDETQKAVKRWLELENEIKTLTSAISERKKEKQTLTTHIVEFMKDNEIPFFNLNTQGKLTLKETTTKTPLSQKIIKSTIETNLSAEDAENLRKILFEDRPTVSKFQLKYKKPT
jgi:hypothetical protein